MMQKNLYVIIGALFGLTALMIGAYTDHVAAKTLAPEWLTRVYTAIRYQQIHAIMICLTGFMAIITSNQRAAWWFALSACCFIIGILLFSGSLYIATAAQKNHLLAMAPYGGMLLMAGWIILMRASMLIKQ